MMPKVSVIVPVYNVEQYLDECVNSLVYQSYENIEIILVDDGSRDNSFEKCKIWTQKDNRVKLLKNSHRGVSVARNVGIDSSTGDWLCFVDSDDYAEPNMLETLVGEARKSNPDFVIGGFYAVSEKRKDSCSFFSDSLIFTRDTNEYQFEKLQDLKGRNLLIKEAIVGSSNKYTNVGVPWGKIYRKSYIREYKIAFVEGLSRMQDTIFNLDVFRSFQKGIYVNKPVYNYRLRNGSVTKEYNPNFHNTAYQVLELLKNRLAEIIDMNDIKGEEFAYEVFFAKKVILLIEIIRLELIRAPKNRKRDLRAIINTIRKYENELSLDNNNNFKGIYLNRNQKLARVLLKYGMEDFFYMLMCIKELISI